MPVLGGCLCFDLPTGSKIIGGIYLFFALVSFLALAIVNLMIKAFDALDPIIALLKGLLVGNPDTNPELASLGRISLTSDSDGGLPNFKVKSEDQKQREEELEAMLDMIDSYKEMFQTIFLVLLILSLLSIITSSLLIHGVRKARRGLLVPWMLQEIVHFVVGILLVAFVFVLLGSVKAAWVSVLPNLLILIIQIFFFVVVLSQFQALGLIRMHDEMCMK